MKLLADNSPNLLKNKIPSKEELIKRYREWEGNRNSPQTSSLVLGMFYSRYRVKYGVLPVTNIPDDLNNIEQFICVYLQGDPTLVMHVIDVLFSLRDFNGIHTGVLLNANVVSKWGLIERAAKKHKKPSAGEQAEFQSDRKHGTLYV